MTTPTQPQSEHRNADTPTPTPTPRTDEMCREASVLPNSFGAQRRKMYLKFARQLERELAELSRHESAELAALRKERDSWEAVAHQHASDSAALRKRVEEAEAYIKKLDGIIEEVGEVTASCINPYEDLKRALQGQKDQLATARRELAEAQKALEHSRSLHRLAGDNVIGLQNDKGRLYNENIDLRAQLAEAVKDRERLDVIRSLMGSLYDGSQSTVTIFQDDATKECFVKNEQVEFRAGSLNACLDAARTAAQPKESQP